MIRFLKTFSCIFFISIASGCELNIDNLSQKANNFSSKKIPRLNAITIPRLNAMKYLEEEKVDAITLDSLLEDTSLNISFDEGFEAAVAAAVAADPAIISLEDGLVAQSSALQVLTSQKRLKGTGAIYGGLEDITDEVAGIALVLNANRALFDGGQLDARIASSKFDIESAKHNLTVQKNQRASDFISLWIDLERYEALNELLNNRLEILDPLIKQLEKVAESGLGDVTMVSAANRTVDTIKVKKTEVRNKLEQARLNFRNAFGALPIKSSVDFSDLGALVPSSITPDMIQASPAMLREYASYRASEATLASVKAQDKVNIGFQMQASRPFGNSEYGSDESVGLVLNKTLFNGNMLKAEIEQSQAQVKNRVSRLRAAYREGDRMAKSAVQTVSTMEAAILLAKSNVRTASEEIAYLKQQLTIGGSTLATVLKAEAGLYEAQAREIDFTSNKRKSELEILAGLGLLSKSLGL